MFSSWIVYPLVLGALCLGCGLLVDRAARRAIPRPLLLPVGFAAIVVIATVMTYSGDTARFASAAVVVAALAGYALVLGGGRRPSLRPPPGSWAPAVAMSIGFGALAAPVVLTGDPGLTGYIRIVDLASQVDLADYLQEHGRSLEGVERDSSYHVVADQLLRNGYPVGAQAAQGATARVARIDVIWAWQPFMAFMGAMLALGLYALLERAIRSRAALAIAAGVAAQPTILYSYALISGVKELSAAVFVALAATLLATPRNVLPAGVAIAAGLCAVSIGIAPWAAILIALAFAPSLLAAARGRRRLRFAGRSALLWLVAAVVVAIPTAGVAVTLEPLLRAGGPADLGNLSEAVPPWSAIGPWLTSDHRYPLDVMGTETLTAVLAVFAGLLAAAGFARAVATRDRGLYAAGAAAVLATAIVVVRGSAWVELKAFAISAPLMVALAFAGAAALTGPHWRRWASLAAGGAVVASILGGNQLVYRNVPLTPYERFTELEDLGKRYAGKGPALHSSFDEFAAYLMRDADLVTVLDVGAADLPRPTATSVAAGFVNDLDAFRLGYLQSYRLIVVRRGNPSLSRPPSQFRLAQTTRFYDVYERDPAAPEVVAHHAAPAPRSPTFCDTLRAELDAAGPRARVAYVAPPDGVVFKYPVGGHPGNWLSDGDTRLARGPGRVTATGSLARGGSYDVWISGSFGRRVTVSVDGRRLGSVRWQESYPIHFEPVAATTLAAGTHTFVAERGGRSILPGTGNELGPEGIITRIGPLSLTRRGPRPPVRVVSARAGLRTCRSDTPLDWIEVVSLR